MPGVNFGGWLPLVDARASAPESPGVLQARGDALVAYPRGRSAMLLYAASRADETLRGYVGGRGAPAIDRAREAGARYVRFGGAAAPEHERDRLLAQFTARFGASPVVNASLGGAGDV